MTLNIFLILLQLCNLISAKETHLEARMSFSMMHKHNVKNFIFFTDAPESAEWNIKEFKHFAKNGIFTTFIQTEKIYEYLEASHRNPHRSTIAIKTENFTRWRFNNWEEHFHVSQSVMYIALTSIDKITAEQWRNIFVRIPYNEEFYIVRKSQIYDFDIKEAYSLVGTGMPNMDQNYGHYSKEKGLISVTEEFYKRRFDLNGTVLTGTLSSPEACLPDRPKCKILEIWEIFGKMMNFRTRYILYQDHFYGIAQLLSYALNPSLSSNFVGPIFKESYYIYMRDILQEDHSLKSYISPFSNKLWFCVFLWVIVLSAAHVTIRIFINICMTQENLKQCYLVSYSPVFSLFNQCDWDTSTNTSMRLMLLTTISLAMIITNSYTATFVSFIMVKKPHLPFHDLESFLEDGSYKLGSIRNTYPYFYFKSSKNSQMQIIYDNYLNNGNDEMESTPDGLLRICIDKKYSFIAHSTAEYLHHKCDILRTPKPIIQSLDGFQLSNYHFKQIFNRNLMTLRSAGIVKKMQDEIDESPPPIDDDSIKEVDFVRITPVLFLFTTGIGLSLGIFLTELIISSQKGNE